MSYDCFISYASKTDLPEAEELHRQLTDAGFSVWFDKARIRDGFNWHREIEGGLEASRVVLPVLTPDWKKSEWTRYETYAAERIIPLVYKGTWDEVKTPPLEGLQGQLSPPVDYERLFEAIHKVLAEPRPDKTARIAHLRHRANPNFVGREKELIQIHEMLFRSPTAVLTQGHIAAVTALGGVGKTTLARQYAEHFWRCYRQMFWADSRIGVETEFATIHDRLRPAPEFAQLKPAEKAAWLRQELARTDAPQRLLILDNAEDQESVKDWIPKSGNCHTLITSRFTAWSVAEKCPVWVLDSGPARELLLKRSGRPMDGSEDAAADAVAEKLGYLPLALEQAAAYVAEQGSGFGFAQYLALYQAHERDLLKDRTPGSTDYPDSVYLTWATTVQKLSPGARAVLRLCSFLASTPIPTEMILKGRVIVAQQAEAMGSALGEAPTELTAREWKRDLLRYSMVEPATNDDFRVHTLVQAVEQHQNGAEAFIKTLDRAVDLFGSFAPAGSHDYANWGTWSVLLPHANRLTEQDPPDHETAPLARVLMGIGGYLYALGRYGEAEPLYARALRDSEKVLGPEHPDTLGSVNNLAFLYESQGRYGEAEPLYARALRDSEKVLGPEHPDTLGSVNNLAFLYESQGRYGEAEPLYARALRDSEKVLGPEHPDTLGSVNNLAFLYESQGRYGEAEPLYARALRDREKVLGPEHPSTLVSVNNLAFLYESQGRYGEAEPLYARALRDSEKVLGPEHPSTLGSVNNLAGLYERQGRYGEAEPLYARALRDSEKVLGPEHPDTLGSVNNLAFSYESQGRYGEAEPLYARALRDREKVLGPEHPDTLGSVNNLAGLYERQGRYGEAEPLYARALAGFRKVLGVGHPNTKIVAANFASFLERLRQP